MFFDDLEKLIGKYAVRDFTDPDRAYGMMTSENLDPVGVDDYLAALETWADVPEGMGRWDDDDFIEAMEALYSVDRGFSGGFIGLMERLTFPVELDGDSVGDYTGTAVVRIPGRVYDGELCLGKYEGNGRLTLEDGTVYEGEFSRGRFVHGRVSRPGREPKMEYGEDEEI